MWFMFRRYVCSPTPPFNILSHISSNYRENIFIDKIKIYMKKSAVTRSFKLIDRKASLVWISASWTRSDRRTIAAKMHFSLRRLTKSICQSLLQSEIRVPVPSSFAIYLFDCFKCLFIRRLHCWKYFVARFNSVFDHKLQRVLYEIAPILPQVQILFTKTKTHSNCTAMLLLMMTVMGFLILIAWKCTVDKLHTSISTWFYAGHYYLQKKFIFISLQIKSCFS